MPVIPATLEAEAGELLEPERWRLWWADTLPLHSSLGDKSETSSEKRKDHSGLGLEDRTGDCYRSRVEDDRMRYSGGEFRLLIL